ncbi:hypothetical protein SKAU_G00289520 [Synaphobranchus kaupii]|uniref:Uncharacterized protein n=1 Tax=Synaphobranchus kaupii TaxID=118154 RepID=A0A9Q1ILY3_SYNKA|nr:hypothetical protein SKAU_G00289520 [Synaphobranchus kaupii]
MLSLRPTLCSLGLDSWVHHPGLKGCSVRWGPPTLVPESCRSLFLCPVGRCDSRPARGAGCSVLPLRLGKASVDAPP